MYWVILSQFNVHMLIKNDRGTSTMIPPGHIDLMKKYYKTISLSSYDLPKVLQDRGVDDPNKLPGFHYRDDALILWDAIQDYISRILAIYYHSDKDIEKV